MAREVGPFIVVLSLSPGTVTPNVQPRVRPTPTGEALRSGLRGSPVQS